MLINHLQIKSIILLSSLLPVFGNAVGGEPGPEISTDTANEIGITTPLESSSPGLQSFNARFKLTRSGINIGSMDVTLQVDDSGHYTYKTSSRPVRWLGWFFKDHLDESSHGIITGKDIKPTRYTYRRTGGKKEKHAELNFDWETMTVENNVDNTPWKMSIPEGAVDRLVVQLAMMQSLTDGNEVISYQVADGGKLKKYEFFVIGTETIDLPAGKFETVKLKKQRSNQKRETILWCAPKLGYLPVRIWQREKDNSEYQSELEDFSYN